MNEIPNKIAIDRLTDKPYAYRDDSDAGMTREQAVEEGIELEVIEVTEDNKPDSGENQEPIQ